MAKAIIASGGGGGTGSDDVTATRGDVLKGVTAVTSDSDDEAAEGTLELTGNAADADVLADKSFYSTDAKNKRTGSMVDRSGSTQSATATLDNSNERVQLTIPNTGKYTNTSKLYTAFSTLASLIGLTAAKLWPGNTVLGITSNKQTMEGRTITPSLSQQTVSCSGKAMTGNIIVGAIPNQRGSNQYAGGWAASGDYYAMNKIPVGYYSNDSSNSEWAPEIRMTKADVRSALGVAANKIKKGEVIAGITGTWEGYVADPNYLYKLGVDSGNWAADPDYPQDLTKESGMMVLDPSGYGANWIYTRNSYNFTGYTRFNIDLMPNGSNLPSDVRIYRYKNDGAIGDEIARIESPEFSSGARKTLTFDITNYNATIQVQIWFFRATSANYKMNFYNVWLS